MIFLLFILKLAFTFAGFCLGLEFMSKGFKKKDRQLFFEGFVLSIVFFLLLLF